YLRANEGTGRWVGEFSIDEGERFVLDAEIAPQWIVESVESVPAGMIADWSQQTEIGRSGRLAVQLSSPLTAKSNIRLQIFARRRSAPWGETLRGGDLAVLKFGAVEVERRLIQIQAVDPYQLKVHDAGDLRYLDPAQLSESDAELIEENSQGL